MNEKILLVEDNRDILATFARILSKEGYVVKTARDGEEGLKYFNEEQFDLLLTDIIMPKIDGVQLIKESKRLKPDIQTIVFTGHGSEELEKQCLKENLAFDYLTKPIYTKYKLLASVKHAIDFRNQKECMKNQQEFMLHEIIDMRNNIDKITLFIGSIFTVIGLSAKIPTLVFKENWFLLHPSVAYLFIGFGMMTLISFSLKKYWTNVERR